MRVVVAPATPPGRSALAIVRWSGDGALDVARAVARTRRDAIPPRRPVRVDLFDADGVFDDGVLLFWPAPRSATGEDVVEVTCHGNPVIVDRLVAACVAAGAQPAGPGEFTRRALLNGKVNLVGAEGVLLAVDAVSRAGLEAARAALGGALSLRFAELRRDLCDAAAEAEARIDYPGDELAHEDDDAWRARVEAIAAAADRLAATYDASRVAIDGARVALVGEVNAGKSSLLNAICGTSRAIVHDRPGTTRDVLEARVAVGSLVVTLLDTAGRRDADDPIEAEGVRRGGEAASTADLVVVVLRARPDGPTPGERALLEQTEGRPRVVVVNAVDVGGRAGAPPGAIATVAPTGEGVPAVVAAIAAALRGAEPVAGALVVATLRQRDRLAEVTRAARGAIAALPLAGPAAAAAELTEAIAALDELAGTDGREDVLSALFARFCIGK